MTRFESVPSVVVEVLSSATRERDLNLKRLLYQQQGVAWCVIADPDASTLLVLKLDANGEYSEIASGETLQMEICNACQLSVDLTRLGG